MGWLDKLKKSKKTNNIEDLKQAVNEWNKLTPAQKKAARNWKPRGGK